MTKEEAIKHINQTRKSNKDNWYYIIITVDGEELRVKGFNTWIQRLEYKGFTDSFNLHKVSDFLTYLEDTL